MGQALVAAVEELVKVGWSQAKLAERIGWTPSNFTTLISGRPVTARSARLVRGLYDDLWNQAPPEESHRDKIAASRARNHASTRGWLPPQAWDDDLIDVPEDQMGAEIARRVAAMTDQELRDCWNARYRGGDHSPLMVAGARECKNRREAGTLERAS